MSEQRRRHAEILGQHLGRRVLEPVAEQERVVLVEVAIVEDQQEFAAVGAEPLDRMRNAAGKYQRSPTPTSSTKLRPCGVDRRDARGAVKHVGPFGLLVPMQLAHAAGVQPHVHAGDVLGDAKLARGDLAGPAAARLPHMRIGKGEAQIGHRPGIRRRRIDHIGVLPLANHVTGMRVRAANAGRPARLVVCHPMSVPSWPTQSPAWLRQLPHSSARCGAATYP